MRTIPNNDHRQFNDPSIWIPLFEISLGEDTYYYTPNPEPVFADGNEYVPFPVILEEVTEDGKGEISTVRLVCSNVEGMLSTKLKQVRNVDGQLVTFKVYSVQVGDVIYEETLEIVKIVEITPQTVVFELGIWNPFLTNLVQEKFLRDFCWNTYKGKGCWIKKSDGSYISPTGFTAGNPDSCNRTLADCKRHNNVMRFNSFPGIPGGIGYV